MNWDPFQRAVLAELGHALYRLPAAAAQAPAETPFAETSLAGDRAMLARLARVVGLAADGAGLPPEIIALSGRLRGDAAAKRALWPRLRALRAGRT